MVEENISIAKVSALDTVYYQISFCLILNIKSFELVLKYQITLFVTVCGI